MGRRHRRYAVEPAWNASQLNATLFARLQTGACAPRQKAAVLFTLTSALRRRDVSSRELVERAIDAIEEQDGAINAVVAARFEQALDEATAVDRIRARRHVLGALAGIPALVKDMEDVDGLPTRRGSLLFADAPPATRDGLVAGRLRAAGTIVVGKTNTPEYGFGSYTSNRLSGPTRNPWALASSPGGSSGGSAAAMAAGMVPIATATDGGGSIRVPASFCGLAGLKPSNGIVAREPLPAWMDFSTHGPIGYTIADLRLLLSIQKGPAPGDPTALPAWRRAAPSRPRRVLATLHIANERPIPAEIEDLFARALTALETELELPVETIDSGAALRAGDPELDWLTMTSAEQAHALGRELIESRGESMDPAFLAYVLDGLETDLETYLAARRRRYAYVAELDELLEDTSLLVTPTVPAPGLPADGRVVGDEACGLARSSVNTLVQNLTGHPALTVPAGRMSDGVPFGLQITGPRFRDDLLLDFGERWEAARPWPLVAPGYRSIGADLDAEVNGQRDREVVQCS
jgi:Asp-tRNA(Asn)/Glu-tRNA(Gln) amidotransferase A subunit family amidase